MKTTEFLAEIKKKFEKGDIDPVDAEWIFCEVLNCNRGELFIPKVLEKKQENKIRSIVKKRLKNVPLAQILKKRDFFGMRLFVNQNVLIPRFETEGLCEIIEEVLPSQNFGEISGVDLGTGSGAIAIALTKHCQMTMTAVDISAKALSVAKKNARLQNVKIEFVKSNMLSKLFGRKFDFVVANPPYIISSDMPKLSKEVRIFEPRIALDGGGDGLQYYRKIIQDSPFVLKEGGWLFFEVGKDRAEEVTRLMRKDFDRIQTKKDLQGIDRYVFGRVKLRS